MSKLRCHISVSLDDLGNAGVQLEQVRAVQAPGVTHLRYRVTAGTSS
jgi:hypothetical protein